MTHFSDDLGQQEGGAPLHAVQESGHVSTGSAAVVIASLRQWPVEGCPGGTMPFEEGDDHLGRFQVETVGRPGHAPSPGGPFVRLLAVILKIIGPGIPHEFAPGRRAVTSHDLGDLRFNASDLFLRLNRMGFTLDKCQ